MSKRILIAVAFVVLNGTWAHAQSTTPTAPATTPPSTTQSTPTTPPSVTPGASAMDANEKPPLKGANSFTEAQAIERIRTAGFTTVENMRKDADGIWRATGSKAGKSMAVAVDYKGNVVETQQ